ncbi:MAG: CheR family methyltransferase [Myxococcota bacterium]|nr:CheR family methyltransferase [Myxococcota bacterium]
MINAEPASKRSKRRFHLSDDVFSDLSKLLEDQVGLCFSIEKRHELEKKLISRFPDCHNMSGAELVALLRTSDKILQEVVNLLTVGESYFFRNKPHFEALAEQAIPQLIETGRRAKELRIWCAGCATGEEPYSLSMLLRERFPSLSDWRISITGTDINTGFLERAKEGIFSRWSFRGVDESIIWKYFTREDEHRYRIHADIRRTVDFRQLNLAEIPFSGRLPEVAYDLIMCRNVLIYFSFQFANQVVMSLGDVARPGSYLFVGHSEAFPALSQLDVIYSNATYYYRYHQGAAGKPSRRSLIPGPALSIPGIGVKTIVPKSPKPLPVEKIDRAPMSKPKEAKPRQRILSARSKKKTANMTEELERARRQVNEGRIEETIGLLEHLALGPGKLDYRVHFLRAIVADQAGRVQESIRSLKQAIFLNKGFIIGHFYLGVIHQREGQSQASRRSFRNARNLVAKLPNDHLLDEAEGLTAGRLKEIVEARFEEIKLE